MSSYQRLQTRLKLVIIACCLSGSSLFAQDVPVQYREPFPEAICDLDTRVNYHSFGHEAVKRGYIVRAPGLIMRCGYGGDPEIEGAERNLLDRRLRFLGTSIIGMELQMIIEGTKTLVRHRPEIDAERIGMTGLSWGGIYTLLVAALYPAVKVAALSGNFRGHDVVMNRVDDPRKPVATFLRMSAYFSFLRNTCNILIHKVSVPYFT